MFTRVKHIFATIKLKTGKWDYCLGSAALMKQVKEYIAVEAKLRKEAKNVHLSLSRNHKIIIKRGGRKERQLIHILLALPMTLPTLQFSTRLRVKNSLVLKERLKMKHYQVSKEIMKKQVVMKMYGILEMV